MSYRERATDKEGMYTSVMNSNIHPIVATFNIESIRKDSVRCNYVIEAGSFIQKENPLFSIDGDSKEAIGLLNMIPTASYINSLTAFPQNIEIKTTVTYLCKKRKKTYQSTGDRKPQHSTDLRVEQLADSASGKTDEASSVRSSRRFLYCGIYRFRLQSTGN